MSIFSQVFGDFGFDSNSVEAAQEFTVLPPGKYPVVVEKAEIKPTKKGNGVLLEVCVKITEGPAVNRKLWARMNIKNPSEVAQKIGQSELAGLCKACGIVRIRDEQELLFKTCIANVAVKDEQNVIRSWSALGGIAPGQAAGHAVCTPTPTGPQTAAPPTTNKLPWQRQ